jgi:hypothetical protein
MKIYSECLAKFSKSLFIFQMQKNTFLTIVIQTNFQMWSDPQQFLVFVFCFRKHFSKHWSFSKHKIGFSSSTYTLSETPWKIRSSFPSKWTIGVQWQTFSTLYPLLEPLLSDQSSNWWSVEGMTQGFPYFV